MEDPHLMRLGHYLEHLEGAGEDGIDMEELEREFLKEPWKAGLTIVRVVDPSGSVKPFIEVVNIKEKDHQHCPFAVYTKLCQEGFEESEAEEDDHVLGVVGLAMDGEDVALPKMKQWEEREKCGELKGMFWWKVPARSQAGQQNKPQVKQTSKEEKKKSETVPKFTRTTTRDILKILTKTARQTGRPKAVKRNTKTPTNSWSGSRDSVTEKMQTRKVKRVAPSKEHVSGTNVPKEVGGNIIFCPFYFQG